MLCESQKASLVHAQKRVWCMHQTAFGAAESSENTRNPKKEAMHQRNVGACIKPGLCGSPDWCKHYNDKKSMHAPRQVVCMHQTSSCAATHCEILHEPKSMHVSIRKQCRHDSTHVKSKLVPWVFKVHRPDLNKNLVRCLKGYDPSENSSIEN